MARVLAIADEVSEALYGSRLARLAPELVIACGDLPFDYLEYVVTMTNVPLLFVPGNHDPDLSRPARRAHSQRARTRTLTFQAEWEDPELGPRGCVNLDGRVVRAVGLTVAGLGGSLRYRPGPNQYTQAQMHRRAMALDLRRRCSPGRQRVDILVSHAAPFGAGDADDVAHAGVKALNMLVQRWSPKLLIHGHVHPYGRRVYDLHLGSTTVVNAVGYRSLEVDP